MIFFKFFKDILQKFTKKMDFCILLLTHFDILKMPLYQNGSGWNRSPTSFFVKFFKTYQKLPRPHFDKKLQNKRTELK